MGTAWVKAEIKKGNVWVNSENKWIRTQVLLRTVKERREMEMIRYDKCQDRNIVLSRG
jgi:hypothetical protein